MAKTDNDVDIASRLTCLQKAVASCEVAVAVSINHDDNVQMIADTLIELKDCLEVAGITDDDHDNDDDDAGYGVAGDDDNIDMLIDDDDDMLVDNHGDDDDHDDDDCDDKYHDD
jgi:hypothetical protein